MIFDWDPKKAESNRKKHGVSFEEAATVFADSLGVLIEDSVYDERFVLIGVSNTRRVLLECLWNSEKIAFVLLVRDA